jgi:hypothetical protein
MTNEYSGRTFEHERIERDIDTCQGATFRRCTFFGCVVRPSGGDGFLSVGADLTFDRCSFVNNAVQRLVLRDWTLSSYRTPADPFFLISCLFARVRFTGTCGSTLILGPQPSATSPARNVIEQGAIAFYKDVDWALDIRDAKFTDLKVLFVPGELVLRNPERHFLVYRERLKSVDRDTLPDAVRERLDVVRTSPFSSTVMIAPDKGRKATEILMGYRTLVDMGIAS